jgi:hypothetical protein
MFSADTTQALTAIIAVFFPLAVGYVTKASWSSGLKAIVLAAISAVSGVVSGLVDPAKPWHWQTAVASALTSFAIAVAWHYGIWKRNGVTAAVQARGVKDNHDLAA